MRKAATYETECRNNRTLAVSTFMHRAFLSSFLHHHGQFNSIQVLFMYHRFKTAVVLYCNTKTLTRIHCKLIVVHFLRRERVTLMAQRTATLDKTMQDNRA